MTHAKLDAIDLLPGEVRALYIEAERAHAIAAGHSLIQLRAALQALAGDWLTQLKRSSHGHLAERIKRLMDSDHNLKEFEVAFELVKNAGNMAAHPEQWPGRQVTPDNARDALAAMFLIARAWCLRFADTNEAELRTTRPPPEANWHDVTYRAALEDDVDAMLVLARRLHDEAEALRRTEHTEAEAIKSTLVDMEGSHRRYAAAFQWYRRASALDFRPDSLFGEATMLIFGLGVTPDLAEGRRRLYWAANRDQADALVMLAQAHLEPDSTLVDKDSRSVAEAVELAERAAALEHPEAFNLLVKIHLEGLGVPVDAEKALHYARRSSDAGFPLAHANLAGLILNDPSRSRFHGEIDALIAKAKAADVPKAWWLEYALHYPADDEMLSDRASAALLEAAERGATGAAFELGIRLLHGVAIVEDILTGGAWMVRAALQDNSQFERARAFASLHEVRDLACDAWLQGQQASPRTLTDEQLENHQLLAFQVASMIVRPDDEWPETYLILMESVGRILSPKGPFGPPQQSDYDLVRNALPALPHLWTPPTIRQTPSPGGSSLALKTPRHAKPHPPSRNGPCPCGSGRRFKACCEIDIQK